MTAVEQIKLWQLSDLFSDFYFRNIQKIISLTYLLFIALIRDIRNAWKVGAVKIEEFSPQIDSCQIYLTLIVTEHLTTEIFKLNRSVYNCWELSQKPWHYFDSDQIYFGGLLVCFLVQMSLLLTWDNILRKTSEIC